MSLRVHVQWRHSRPALCGICHTSSSAGRNRSPQRRRLTCAHLRQREMNRFLRSDLNLTDPKGALLPGFIIRNSGKDGKRCRILHARRKAAPRIQLRVFKPAHRPSGPTESARAAAAVALIYQHKLRQSAHHSCSPKETTGNDKL